MTKSTVHEDVERLMGVGIVRQDALVRIAEQVWTGVPLDKRRSYTAAQWRDAIYLRCQPALKKAVDQLTEENGDVQRMLESKLRVLNVTFVRQVAAAMQEVSDKLRNAALG